MRKNPWVPFISFARFRGPGERGVSFDFASKPTFADFAPIVNRISLAGHSRQLILRAKKVIMHI
jgi:hypothetical protein